MSLHEAVSTFRGHRVPHFRIIERKKVWFAVSGALIVLSLLGIFVRGLSLSIDFKGGALLQYPNNTAVSTGQVETEVANLGRPNAQVQVVNGNQLQVRTATLSTMSEADRQALLAGIAKQAGTSVGQINVQDVGPTWGSEISKKALQGLIIFLVLVTLYIIWRFEWKMAVGALVAMLHDLIVTAGIYALFGFPVTPETVIAILTILGYSLYDTVVIFDKVRENTESTAVVLRDGYSAVVNRSLNQTLMRSVNTSLVVLLPIFSLLLFGGATLKNFAFALFIGVASGTYSSIFVASPILAVLKEREPKYRQLRARAEAKAAAGERAKTRATVTAVAAVAATVADPAGSDGSSAPSPAKPKPKPTGQGQRRPANRRKPPAKRKRR
jgi:preprotein translocase subunit SecF